MNNKIIVSNLLLSGRHGVDGQETAVGNLFGFTVEVEYPFAGAAAADDLNGTINYAEIVELVKEVNARPSRLLENVAWRIVGALTGRFPAIKSGRVRVTKLSPPIPNCEVGGVSAEISW